jgi:hypothetical protein
MRTFVFFPDEHEIKFNGGARESKLQSMSFPARAIRSRSLVILKSSVVKYSAQESKQETVNQEQVTIRWRRTLRPGGKGEGGFYMLPFMTHVK